MTESEINVLIIHLRKLVVEPLSRPHSPSAQLVVLIGSDECWALFSFIYNLLWRLEYKTWDFPSIGGLKGYLLNSNTI